MSDLEGKRLAILGLGKLGGILLRSFIEGGLVSPDQVRATDKRLAVASKLADEFKVELGEDNKIAAEASDIILLCVKPRTVLEVVRDIAPVLRSKWMTSDRRPVLINVSITSCLLSNGQAWGPATAPQIRISETAFSEITRYTAELHRVAPGKPEAVPEHQLCAPHTRYLISTLGPVLSPTDGPVLVRCASPCLQVLT